MWLVGRKVGAVNLLLMGFRLCTRANQYHLIYTKLLMELIQLKINRQLPSCNSHIAPGMQGWHSRRRSIHSSNYLHCFPLEAAVGRKLAAAVVHIPAGIPGGVPVGIHHIGQGEALGEARIRLGFDS